VNIIKRLTGAALGWPDSSRPFRIIEELIERMHKCNDDVSEETAAHYLAAVRRVRRACRFETSTVRLILARRIADMCFDHADKSYTGIKILNALLKNGFTDIGGAPQTASEIQIRPLEHLTVLTHTSSRNIRAAVLSARALDTATSDRRDMITPVDIIEVYLFNHETYY
jgi:hypothetical protein